MDQRAATQKGNVNCESCQKKLPLLGVRRRKGNVKWENQQNSLPLKLLRSQKGNENRESCQKKLPLLGVRRQKGNVKWENQQNSLLSRSSREPALRALPPAAQAVRFDKVRKEANGLQPLASFFLQAHKTQISQSQRLWDIRCTHIILSPRLYVSKLP